MQNEKILDSTNSSIDQNERPHTWRERFRQQVEQANQSRKLEAAERLRTKSERSRYIALVDKELRMPEMLQELRKFWKIEKEHGFWYVRFDQPLPQFDVIVLVKPKPGVLVLGLDREGINAMERFSETFQPVPRMITSDRFMAYSLKVPQIVALLEVAQDLTGQFAAPDFLPTLEEWDLADRMHHD